MVLILALLRLAARTRSNNAAATPMPTAAPVTTPAAASTPAAVPGNTAAAAPTSDRQKQTLNISGSTTVLPIAQAAADKYMAAHPEVNIQVSGGGSGVGIQAIGAKTVDIGMSSRDVTKDEMAKYPDFVITPSCTGRHCHYRQPGQHDPVYHLRSGQADLYWQYHQMVPDYRSRCPRHQ